jgi:hypothetical protein
MTREEKYLVIDDISGRIPHGVVFKTDWGNKTLKGIQYDNANTLLYFGVCNFTNKVIETYVSEVKPYLLPMASMTEEKRKYISDRWGINENFDFEIDPNWGEYYIEVEDAAGFIDWLNRNHYDYRGLIPKKLALDATGLDIYANFNNI